MLFLISILGMSTLSFSNLLQVIVAGNQRSRMLTQAAWLCSLSLGSHSIVGRHSPHHPRRPCPQHPCLLSASHPPDRVRCSSCWPQDPGRRVGTVAPAPSGRAQHSHARGPARSLGDGRGGWTPGRRHWEAQRQVPQPHPHPGAPPSNEPRAPAQLLSPVPPAQGCRPQGVLSCGAPGQGAPPFLGGGSTQLRRRLRWPPPHETLQGPQASHSLTRGP